MRYLIFLLLVFFARQCWSGTDTTSKSCTGPFSAKLVSLQGKLFFDPDGKGHWQSAHLNESFCEGSRVRVEPYSRASLLLPDGIVLRLDEGTVLTLNGIGTDQPTLLALLKGFVHFISRTTKRLEISSPIANAGPEGTEFAMRIDGNKASLWVYEGGVKFFNPQGSVHLLPGQGAQAQLGQAPQAHITIKPQDAVNWALYYPPILPYPLATTAIGNDVRTAIRDYRQGRCDAALLRLDALPPAQQTPYFFKVRAAIRLSVGRDQLALQDIDAVLANRPNDAEALALQSVLALTQNRKEEAYALANRAVAAGPNSATAYSALSYAEQSRFALDKAQEAAKQAVRLAPDDSMVWARQAELELAQGLATESAKTAQQALRLDTSLERTQTVMGFAYLLRTDLDAALQSFTEAVRLDSSSPLARLGLGLSKIRKGDLPAGRQDLEIAAILDPNNSLIRSYLGKAYYEEKRTALAEDQFNLAKQRDPKDPTPYFYGAIQKQTTNRPVEALHDMEQAKELNNNRAVYRSSLLLDKDLAARSAAQGRIYNDLGFQRLGLLEGWKSVNTDPTNYSAHRLLADSYASQPRHEIARVSELLQSQLLQPLNITPIQPQLGQSNILIVDGLGPSSLSFNEYNPMFARNRYALQTSGIYGGNNTWGEDAVHSGLWNQFSYSLGQFHYETDGFRQNNFVKQNIYNAFIQGNVSDSLNLQAEFRYEKRKNGDLSINFDPDAYSAAYRENRNIASYRVGGRYTFSEKSSLIGSFIYQDVTSSENDILFTDVLRDSSQNRSGGMAELQHIYKTHGVNLINGAGYIGQSVKSSDNITIIGFPDPFPPSPPERPDVNRSNLYNYSTFNLASNMATTLGLSYDHLEIKNQLQRDPLNPKFGLVWKPLAAATFRAAAFRSMNITRTANQSIEPTQIAGFNQLFDDDNGTVAWRYGAGFDYQFTKNLAVGLEYTERNLDVPRGLSASLDWKETQGKTYIYLTPHDWISISAEYFYEKFNRQEYNFSEGVDSFKTTNHWLPLTVNLIHPSGFSLIMKDTYVYQSGTFNTGTTITPGHDDFFIVDLSLNYRLPSRFGMISLGVKNLFDSRFHYQDINSTQSSTNENYFAPQMTLFTRIKLAY
ncbi:MAG: tetratricopeptide repeat protein [Methylovulum miyakonense]|uniref:tetratricopeptide repeat protein n=1 Tax=Methylovulum miyakonense TaxID=645578 RepID=UPI003BB57EB8